MSLPRLTLSLLILVVAAVAGATERAAPALPLAECLNPDRARAWHMIDSDEILVDAGRRRFHLRLSWSCHELTNSNAIGFRAANGMGRICGRAGDALLPSRPNALRVPCGIASVTPVSKEQFNAISAGKDAREVLLQQPQQPPTRNDPAPAVDPR